MSHRTRSNINQIRLNLVVCLIALACCIGSAFSQCRSPLDDATIRALTFNTFYSSFQLRPGETIDLDLIEIGCCYYFEPVNACTVWSVDDGSDAHIDSQTGVVSTERTALPGHKVTVTANVEGGRRILTVPLYIYSSETHPLVGVWTEVKRFSCKSGDEISTNEPIRELVFRADGTMYVTRQPFEIYHDYIASYGFELESGTISFRVELANATPMNVDGAGRFRGTEDGGLVLKKLSLGRFSNVEKKACRYEFKRIGSEH